MEKHYTLLKAAELLGVTTQTLRNWDNAGKIQTIRTPGNQRRIPESEITRILNPMERDISKAEQKPQRSINEMREAYDVLPEGTEYTEAAQSEIQKEDIVKLPPVVVKSEDNYLLICKDTVVYDITRDLVLDESLLPGCMLKGTMNFSQWMETRYSRDTNFSSQRLMQRAFGLFDHEHAAYTTGALSLSDCYRIKRLDEDILFTEVTPYIHKEWDGVDTYGVQNDYIWGSLSNLFTGGKTDKRWIDAQTLLKVNSFGEAEPFLLCAALELENIAEAQKTEEGLILGNFTSPDYFYESMEQSGFMGEYDDPRDFVIEKYKELATALFVVDYLIENNDRHPDDYGFLRSSDTGEYISMAPYYNFDRVWSGDAAALPDSAWQGYRGYIYDLCRRAISVAGSFEYGTIIEKRAGELLRV